jgi:hypothetical protein
MVAYQLFDRAIVCREIAHGKERRDSELCRLTLEKRLQIQKAVNLNLNRPLAVARIRSPVQKIMTTGMEKARAGPVETVAATRMRVAS